MPKLLYVNTTIGRGSTGKIIDLIASIARTTGWDCIIAHGSRFIGKSTMTSYQVTGRTDEIWHYILSRVFDCHGLGTYAATKRLLKKIDEERPDVIHIHNIHGYYINYKVLFQYLIANEIPTVITMHDFWLMTGHCAYISKSCNKWETGCGNCRRLKEYPAAFLDRSRKNWMQKQTLLSGFKWKNLVVVPVSYWLEVFTKHSLLGNCQIRVIQNGVDINVFHPYQGIHTELWKRIDWNKYSIIAVADRWTEANGYNLIMDLSLKLPDDMQIVMVGLNDNQQQGLPQNIIGVGHTENVEQLIELYTSADVLFNPSTEVTFGLVTVEAMACGTPTIVFKNTAGEEIIDEKTGFAIANIDEIPELVRNCRKNADLYKTNCRKRILENFNHIKQYSKYIALYNELCKDKR